MNIDIVEKASFTVIGKEGTTDSGSGFVEELWKDANLHFCEVAHLAKTDADGRPIGCWGAMSDMMMRFLPWENDFSKGRYLAGIECLDDASAPSGWTKWTIPGFRCVRIECEGADTFRSGLKYLYEHGYTLAGAVQDFTDLSTGKNYMCFPTARL